MKYTTNPSSKDGINMTLRLISGCLAMLIIGSLSGTSDAGANRTRFDFNYQRTFKKSLIRSKPVAMERFAERWIGSVPPWHREVLENITFPGLSRPELAGSEPEITIGNRGEGAGDDGNAVTSDPIIHVVLAFFIARVFIGSP